MPRIQGVGPRIAARLIEMGFKQPNGKPDVRGFAETLKYDKSLAYEWVADRRTPTKEVTRLCADLQFSHGYLLYGEGRPKPYRPLAPISGAADGSDSRGVAQVLEKMFLVRRWLLGLVQPLARPMQPSWCPA